MKLLTKFSTIIMISSITFNSAYAENISDFSFNAIPPEAMQAIDTINQSLANRNIPLFEGRAISAGIGALAGVFMYNNFYHTAINTVVTNQLPMMTSAVIGSLIADYIYRQYYSISVTNLELPF
jgi:hypothetical protein